ncbi:MAG: zinc-ribbon domain-containing protein [Candidatus Scatosoma sp.]
MYCSKCGKEMPDDAVVCTGCGCLLRKKEERQKVNNNEMRGDGYIHEPTAAGGAENDRLKKAALLFLVSLALLCVSRIANVLGFRAVAIIFALAATGTGIVALFFGIKQKKSISLGLLTIAAVCVAFTQLVVNIAY